MKVNNRFLIKTHNGYKNFDGIQKSTDTDGLKIIFDDNTFLECTLTHRILKNNDFVCAKDLRVNDIINNKKITNIERIYNREFYDPVNVEGDNTYEYNDITNHNCDVVVVDECAFIPASKYDAFADSVYPSQSSKAWKKNILLSTANGLNHFYQIVKKAKEPKKPDLHITKEKLDKIPKESIKSVTEENNLYNVEYNTSSNGFTLYEVDWKDVPRYDKDGNVLDPETFKQQVIDKYGEVYFNQNYANSFIGSSYTLINAESLSKFTSTDPILKKDNMLDVFKEPQKKHSYILSVDTAKDGQDFFSVHVVDITKFPFEQVASCNIQTDYFLMPEYLDDWGKWYNNAYMIIENNDGSGQSVADMMKNDYEYENLHYDTTYDAVKRRNVKKKYPGFRNTPRTRKLVLDTLKLFIENGNLIVNDFHTIDQFYTFILVNGKYQADDGCHDDLVMALAISFAPFCNTKNFSEMKTIIKNFYDNSKQSNEDFSSNMIYGRFDDFSDSSFDNSDNFSCFES